MRLKFNGSIVNFKIIEESNIASRHSSKELQYLSIQVIAYGEEENKEILRLIDIGKQEGCSSVDDENNILKQWKIANAFYIYNNSSLYTHDIQIQELELLEVNSLEIGEVLLKPYFYEEHFDFDSDVLNVIVKSIINKSQQSSLKNMQDFEIPVIRHGIDERPRQMVLSLGVWSKTDTNIKHEIRLRDVENDLKKEQLGGVFDLVYGVSVKSAESQALLDLLLTTLINKNILSEEEINKLRDDARGQISDKMYSFYEVNDIDS